MRFFTMPRLRERSSARIESSRTRRKLFWWVFQAGGLIALVASLLTPMLVQARPLPASPDYNAVDAYLAAQMKDMNIPGLAVGIVHGDHVEHLQAFGSSQPGGPAITAQTPFLLGSVSKSFTALGIMQLAEAGAIDLDSPVQRYLPWFSTQEANAAARITVRQLLYQTSGISHTAGQDLLLSYDFSPGARERMVSALSTVPLAHAPGTVFEYSNMNYVILGLVIEVVTGQHYDQYIQEHIFQPLDMKNSYANPALARLRGLAQGHRYWFGFPMNEEAIPIASGAVPAGYLASSAEDLTHYLIMQMNDGQYEGKRVISTTGLFDLHRPGVRIDREEGTDTFYAMGWFVGSTGGIQAQYHNGILPDYHANLVLLPDTNRGIAVLINAGNSLMSAQLDRVAAGVAALVSAGQPPQPSPAWVYGLHAMAALPVLQLLGFLWAAAAIARWGADPERRPNRSGRWLWFVILPLLVDLAIASGLLWLAQGPFALKLLYTPDLAYLALGCGVFSLLWGLARTVMMGRVMGKRIES
jgi:CubicO group peptidase (beta-lactamase class C family)